VRASSCVRLAVCSPLSAIALCSSMVAAQAPPPAQAPPAQTPPAAPQAEAPPPPKAYRYESQGRRDPFVSLLSRGVDSGASREPGRRIDTPAGLLVDELTLKGIVLTRGEYVAMIQGPDTKTFIVRANDRLLDGMIRSISAQTLVIMQDVSDPLSVAKQREVRKVLRGPQEGK
jgi:Tfp pilus assembly protein PilP